ncbi:hypothetical protein [Winogradskya humida]|uniref:DUF1963 domain-containing protein n=1 Tax=Winogradskya humida TaxID=113566 RepID=A0ABQ3ZT77_9ACTN|nr:hypothetical protein [Actinoplanes humidus]GIE21790.1 hypothetical protein Ahu01nite_048920 [Actinoplanes humidus]
MTDIQTRRDMVWRTADGPIEAPVAKLGGQPFWLDEPFWPTSAGFGTPMMFIGQFPVPGPHSRLAFLFMAEDGYGTGSTYEPEDGDNALIVQPGGRVPPFLTGTSARTGPTLWRRGESWTDRVPVELHIDTVPPGGGDSYFGGEPHFWQPSTRPSDASSSSSTGRTGRRTRRTP